VWFLVGVAFVFRIVTSAGCMPISRKSANDQFPSPTCDHVILPSPPDLIPRMALQPFFLEQILLSILPFRNGVSWPWIPSGYFQLHIDEALSQGLEKNVNRSY